jgi:glycine betaine catabolism B
MEFIQKVLSVADVTHDVRCIRIAKPEGYSFVPGQATEVAINKPRWRTEKRPFTFTSLGDDPYLEFIIKCYSDHDGVTREILNLSPGDELIIGDAWGAIEYKGEGYFIAGGAGITPFIAIFRQLHREGRIGENRLFFSNKTANDIICEHELISILGDKCINILTDDNKTGYLRDFINEAFLTKHVNDFSKHFYICGPDKMIESISSILTAHGAAPDAVVFEK